MKKPVSIKIAYIGGGSKGWAGILMNDLALAEGISGEVALYDIDQGAARRNEVFGNWLNARPATRSDFTYRAVPTLASALKGADFVICSITPAPLRFMGYDLKLPGQYGIIQTVGDTVGAGGIIRSMRAIPIYERFAHEIMRHCPKAWVINYTNPMTVLTRTLSRVEPRIKSFGCCHEVFGTQGFLAGFAANKLGVKPPPRHEIKIKVMGVNHFTWITEASWKGRDLLELLRKEMGRKNMQRRFSGKDIRAQLKKAKGEPWGVNNHQVTLELFKRYGILPAAGDRHLAEFVPGFLSSLEETHRWGITPTTIEFRLKVIKDRIKRDAERMRNPDYKPAASGEEGANQIKALLGLGDLRTNVNFRNLGQMAQFPGNAVVETNAVFSKDSVKPIPGNVLPKGALGLVLPHSLNQELLVEGALKRDLGLCFQAFMNDPCMTLPADRAHELFGRMVRATSKYLKGYK